MRGQKGVTLSGFILWAILGIIVLLLGFRVGPAYWEFYAIERQFQAIISDPEVRGGTRREIEAAFVKRATMENIQAIGYSDLRIAKDGSDVVISAEYSVRVPLFGNLSACMEFKPSSRKK